MAHCGCILRRSVRKSVIILKNAGVTRWRCTTVRALSYRQRHLQAVETGKGGFAQHTSFQQGRQSEDFTEHDYDPNNQENENEEYEHAVKQRILESSLAYVHEFGWTKKALEAGASIEGFPPIAQGIFPNGGAELIHYFYIKSNTDLADVLKQELEAVQAEGLEKPKTKQLIRDALERRLRMIIPYIDKWPQAMAIQAMPLNSFESWKNLLNLADDIWYYAGDRSVDYNWYTKRLMLAGVYKSSEIYMIQDKSHDYQDTLAFMDRRLQDLQNFGASKKAFEGNIDVLKGGLLACFIMGRNILGMNSRNR